jgi:molybdopterin molybdotransferase
MPDDPKPPMISSSEAAALIRARLPRLAAETRSIDHAAGAILRQSISAERDQPPFDRVSMDGIVIRFEDVAAGTRGFAVAGMQAAGMAPLTLGSPGACIEVMTGAVLPTGCDTVIAVEQTRRDGARLVVDPDYQPQRGQFIHRRGSDCHAGDTLIDEGALLRAPELAVIAANGYASVQVARPPRVGIVATGDELVGVDGPVAPWQIRRSNDRALAAMLAGRGLRDVTLEHVADERDALLAAIARQLQACDVLILTGGVSMGQRDYVPEVLHELGVERVFHKIAQRPGKPMWFGIGAQGQAVFALPGNPVSALVCAARYVLPALLESMGQTVIPPRRVTLAAALDHRAALTWFVPVRLQPDELGGQTALPLPPPTSGDFSGLTHTDGCVELPPGPASFPIGFIANYYSW